MTRRKTMLAWVQEYIEHRRSLGFRMRIEGDFLLSFGQYADRSGHRGPVTEELAVEWARLPQG